MEADIRKLSKRRGGNVSSDSEEEKKKKKSKVSYLQEELSKYSKGLGAHKKGKKKDESGILAAMHSFRSKLQKTTVPDDEQDENENAGRDSTVGGEEAPAAGDDPGMEVDDDRGFMGHELHFPKDDGEETVKAERDYEVIDPRARNARAKEEERQRKKESRKDRGRHRR